MMKSKILALVAMIATLPVHADDGSRLWLRSAKNVTPAEVKSNDDSNTALIAQREIADYWRGKPVTLVRDKALPDDDGYTIEPAAKGGGLTIRARRSAGLMYGAYELLRIQAVMENHSGFDTQAADIRESSSPALKLRMLNHWDNLDGSIERGYAGRSIWKWDEIDGRRGTMSIDMRERLTMYCRANASLGINATVLNNVNASPKILSTEYIQKVKTIANLFRKYNIRVFLSVNFASPISLGGLQTADPLDPAVRLWWKNKAREIYKEIPDFGGFLVKANSEGQPGPGDYGRSHAEGANMLAEALASHKGLVIWRSFVYGNHKGEDRVMQAVSEFKPCDGKFAKNVLLQSKNGPLDFQPREPYAPIFDQIKHTPQMAELQITQEYLGQSRHLVYLATMWKEFFGFVDPKGLSGIAGVANIGDDKNWCGHHFSQANWYAFGRLAWNPSLTADSIATEWIEQTFTADKSFVRPVKDMMMTSREACVGYMMPYGLHHIFKADHHYGPEPQGYYPKYPIEWCPVYYHKADTAGIGFDRSSAGTNAVSQYREPYATMYNDLKTCPEEYLLWFHHVPWTYQMRNGETLWANLCQSYSHGVSQVEQYIETWKAMKPYVDEQRFNEVNSRLLHQLDNAKEWRNVCLGYFSAFSRQVIK